MSHPPNMVKVRETLIFPGLCCDWDKIVEDFVWPGHDSRPATSISSHVQWNRKVNVVGLASHFTGEF